MGNVAAEDFKEPVQLWTCAAVPVVDPDTGRILGTIELTGDLGGDRLSLSVVVATVRAVEELLSGRLHERDDRLRARYGQLLGPRSAGAAVVTGTGRVLLDPARHGSSDTTTAPPSGGRMLALASDVEAIAEPVESDDVYFARPRRTTSRAQLPLVELRVLGDQPAEVRLDGTPVHLRPRHIELLTLLAMHHCRLDADALCSELYGDNGHPASVRVEMSRLRRQLPGAVEREGYRLAVAVDSDVERVRALLGRGAVRDAAAAYRGPLLPGSAAPGIVRAREELDAWLRQAAITSGHEDALWAWVSSPSGLDDLLAWRRLLSALRYTDARRSLAVARVTTLRRSLGCSRQSPRPA